MLAAKIKTRIWALRVPRYYTTLASTLNAHPTNNRDQFDQLLSSFEKRKLNERKATSALLKATKTLRQCNPLQSAIYNYKSSLAYKIWQDGDCLDELDTADVTSYLEIVANGLQTMSYEEKLEHMEAVLGWVLVRYASDSQGSVRPKLRQLAATYKVASRKRNSYDVWNGKLAKYDALFDVDEDKEAKIDLELYKMLLKVRCTEYWSDFVLQFPKLRQTLALSDDEGRVRRYTLLMDNLLSCVKHQGPNDIQPLINACLEDLETAGTPMDDYLQSIFLKTLTWLYRDFDRAKLLLQESKPFSAKPFFAVVKGYALSNDWKRIWELYSSFALPQILNNKDFKVGGEVFAYLLHARLQLLMSETATKKEFKQFWKLVLRASQSSGGVIYPLGQQAVLDAFHLQFGKELISIGALQEISGMVQDKSSNECSSGLSGPKVNYSELAQFQKSFLNAYYRAVSKGRRSNGSLKDVLSIAHDLGVSIHRV